MVSEDMLTQQEVFNAIKNGARKTNCFLDSRDFGRLVAFFPTSDWTAFGFEPTEHTDPERTPTAWTERNIVKQIVADATFGLEKAEDERGISSAMMAGVLTMWSWIMADPDLDGSHVDGYGARFFREALEKYTSILAALPD